MNLRVLLIALGSFLVSALLGLTFIQVLVNYEVENQLDARLEQESVAYRAVIQGLSHVAQTLYDETINTHKVTALVKEITSSRGEERDISRGRLLRELYPSYMRLKAQGIRQLHFHGADGLSLLRLHNPLSYGDSLFEVRESVRLANTELEPVEGFEVGRHFHGFRFVFPLYHGNEHVGSVEISVPFATIEASLEELVPNEQFEFVLDRSRVFSMLYPSERSIYRPFGLNDAFVIEDIGSRLGHPREVSELQQGLEALLIADREQIRVGMLRGESFGLTTKLQGKRYAALFVPIEDVAQDVGAYILTYTQVSDIEHLYRDGIWIQLSFLALMASLATSYYRRQTSSMVIAREREKLQSITERMAEGLLVQDEEGRVTFLNEAAEKILGADAEAVIGQVAHELFHVHYDEHGTPVSIDDCPIRTETTRGQVYESENEYFRRISDQQLVPVQVTSARFMVAGEAMGSITIFRDVTERKRYEADLKRARHEAEESAHAKSEFLANMSHEIRTPMNGILGMLELVQETRLSPEQKDFLGIAQSSGRTLMSLLNSLLDLAKYEAGKVELEQVDFSLRKLLEETVKLFAPQAQGKGLEIAALLDDSVPEYANGDPTRLRQVITNLLGNAVKFTEVGEVTLSASIVIGESAEPCLHVVVRDTGIGIALDAQARIFDSFSQADGSTTRKYGGTGLGLTLSREIVNHMGGRLWLQSEPDQGSEFHFTVQLQNALEPSALFVPNEELKGLKALIVDDNATNRLIIERYCDSWDIAHESARNGEEALQLLELCCREGGGFDLILTDMMMPEMDGVALAEKIRADGRFDRSRLILITSYTGRALHQQADGAGFACMLAKPIGRDELHDAIERAIAAESLSGSHESLPSPKELACLLDMHVLLVEDNAVNRMVASANLVRLGCTVSVAENGEQALQVMQEQPFDLVLMDCQMPVMDGLTATRAFREYEREHRNESVPIVAMTAFISDNDIQHCLEAGMDAHIGKPFEPEKLRALLLQYCHPRLAETGAEKEAGKQAAELNTEVPVLARQVLDELDELLDGEVDMILQPFIEQLPELLAQVRQGLEKNDLDLAHRAAHTLKSSAANVGGMHLSELSRVLELSVFEQDSVILWQQYHNLSYAADELVQALTEFMVVR